MGWTVQVLNPSGGDTFHTHPDRPWDLPTSYTMGTGSFPEVKWLGHGVIHPPPSIIEVKERVKLYHYLPLCLHGR